MELWGKIYLVFICFPWLNETTFQCEWQKQQQQKNAPMSSQCLVFVARKFEYRQSKQKTFLWHFFSNTFCTEKCDKSSKFWSTLLVWFVIKQVQQTKWFLSHSTVMCVLKNNQNYFWQKKLFVTYNQKTCDSAVTFQLRHKLERRNKIWRITQLSIAIRK